MVACGGAPEGVTELDPDVLEVSDLGKLEQALFLYTDYGMENSSAAPRCSLPYAGGICMVPMRKTVYYHIYPWQQLGGCYGDFWTDSMQQAVNGLNAWNTAFQTGFKFVSVSESDPRLSLYMWCDAPWQDGNDYHMGSATPVAWGHCQDHGSDEVCKIGATWLQISGNNIIQAALALGATATQRNRRIENTTRHELGHVMGLGHYPLAPTAGVLMSVTNPHDLSDGKWNSLQAPSSYEGSLIWGYCPGGNTANCQ